jgi:hypothetical protein
MPIPSVPIFVVDELNSPWVPVPLASQRPGVGVLIVAPTVSWSGTPSPLRSLSELAGSGAASNGGWGAEGPALPPADRPVMVRMLFAVRVGVTGMVAKPSLSARTFWSGSSSRWPYDGKKYFVEFYNFRVSGNGVVVNSFGQTLQSDRMTCYKTVSCKF